jgi:2-(1,2-epoxy-1,2-dihydrophenyl)acetyl-CoA isomerase
LPNPAAPVDDGREHRRRRMGLIAEERRGAILIWTLDREARLNALPDLGDGDEVAAACERVNADPSVRCVVLTGAGRAFSAGGDLTAMRDRRDLFEGSGPAIRERYRRVVHRIVRSLYGLEVPLIAAVNGPAMGLGCDIAGLGDIRIASDRASFGVPFLKLGIIPGDGGSWLLPRNIGYARAAELLFTARSIDAATAAEWGLVNRVVAHDSLMDEALTTAAQVAAQPPQALRMAKTLLRQGRDTTFDQMLEMSAAMQALAHLTDDHQEGVAAVLEKRPGDFTGN